MVRADSLFFGCESVQQVFVEVPLIEFVVNAKSVAAVEVKGVASSRVAVPNRVGG